MEVSGPDSEEAADAVDSALDTGSIQDAIADAAESLDLDFEIESAGISEIERRT